MKIECTVEELKEMLSKKETPAVKTTDVSNPVLKMPKFDY